MTNLRPVAEALQIAGYRTTAQDHRRMFVRQRTMRLYIASFAGSCRGIPPERRRLIAQRAVHITPTPSSALYIDELTKDIFVMPPCLRNVRVKANSPSLCPTMFSVMNVGKWLFPL